MRRVVPFYGCPECGWATIASRSTATQTHQLAVPDCSGTLERIEDWLFPGDEPEHSVIRSDAGQRRGS
jgi:hypothetical protein